MTTFKDLIREFAIKDICEDILDQYLDDEQIEEVEQKLSILMETLKTYLD